MPSGARRKLSVKTIRRDEPRLRGRLALAERAQQALPQMESNLSLLRQQSVGGGAVENVQAGRAGMMTRTAESQVRKAKSLVGEIPALTNALAMIPSMVLFGEQLHERADVTVAFEAERAGRVVNLTAEPVE